MLEIKNLTRNIRTESGVETLKDANLSGASEFSSLSSVRAEAARRQHYSRSLQGLQTNKWISNAWWKSDQREPRERGMGLPAVYSLFRQKHRQRKYCVRFWKCQSFTLKLGKKTKCLKKSFGLAEFSDGFYPKDLREAIRLVKVAMREPLVFFLTPGSCSWIPNHSGSLDALNSGEDARICLLQFTEKQRLRLFFIFYDIRGSSLLIR